MLVYEIDNTKKLVLEQQSNKVNPQFRLWLTSAPHPDFPVAILRGSVKLCSQSSKGIRGNMLRNLLRIDKEIWDARVSNISAQFHLFICIVPAHNEIFDCIAHSSESKFSPGTKLEASRLVHFRCCSSGNASLHGRLCVAKASIWSVLLPFCGF